MFSETQHFVAPAFVPPPYPFERLAPIAKIAAAHDGGIVDYSIGTPCDPPPAAVIDALATSNTERGYPASIGSVAYRDAASQWIERCFGVTLDLNALSACVGTKEFVATTPQWLKLRRPDLDTVLYPAVAYPTYEMGATLAGCRGVPVALLANGAMDLSTILADDAKRALCIWSNSPSNPTGALDDLAAVATWGRANNVPVLSDECYCEFTWDGPPQSILQHGTDGVVALHSLSKRSNLAGARAGVFAGDAELVSYLSEVRKHAGFMVPGPVQAAAVAAWGDQAHVATQREIYRVRLERLRLLLIDAYGLTVDMPKGGFYLWIEAPAGFDGWSFTEKLAQDLGVLGAPGEFYGTHSPNHVRLAVVQPDASLDLIASRVARKKA